MAYPPMEPTALHSHMMDLLHGSMAHPRIGAQQKASYAKLLAALAADQVRHQAQQQRTSASPGQMGGVQQPEESGLPAGIAAMPHIPVQGPGGVQMPQDNGYPVGQVQAMPDYTALLAGLAGQHVVTPRAPLLAALAGHVGY